MLHRFFSLVMSLIVWILSKQSQAILLFPENTVIQFTLGISVPVAMSGTGGVVFSSGFQLNYALPWNLSQLEATAILNRRTRDLTLQDLYSSFEDTLDNMWMNVVRRSMIINPALRKYYGLSVYNGWRQINDSYTPTSIGREGQIGRKL